MVERATILSFIVGAIALVVLLVTAGRGGAPAALAADGQHPAGQYKTTISCGNTTVQASEAAISKDEGAFQTIWDKPGAVPICQAGNSDSKVWNAAAGWNRMLLFYQCPKTPQDDLEDKNTLVFLSNELKLGVSYTLVCPSDPRSTHGPTPAAGEVGGSAGVGGPAGPGGPTVRTVSTVGGIAELPEADAAPLAAGDSSGTSAGVMAGIAAAIAAGAIALGGAGWYARRRWLG